MKGCCGFVWTLINCYHESSLEHLPYWNSIWTAGHILYSKFNVSYFQIQIFSYFCNFKLQAGECSIGHFFRGNSVLWTGRECYYQIQVMMIVIYLSTLSTKSTDETVLIFKLMMLGRLRNLARSCSKLERHEWHWWSDDNFLDTKLIFSV